VGKERGFRGREVLKLEILRSLGAQHGQREFSGKFS
jgi:hypothetical protein